jgi:hypothetical protein
MENKDTLKKIPYTTIDNISTKVVSNIRNLCMEVGRQENGLYD